jgi:hypothetical protein
VEYLARQLNHNTDTNNNNNNNNKMKKNNGGSNSDAGMRQMHVQSVEGVKWGLFVMMGG